MEIINFILIINYIWKKNDSLAEQGDQNFEIGRDTYVNSKYWNGLIDDLRIYNRALSESEITTLYNLGK